MKKLIFLLILLMGVAPSGAVTNYNVTCDTTDTVNAQLCEYDVGRMTVDKLATGNASAVKVQGVDNRDNGSGYGLNVDFTMNGLNLTEITGLRSTPASVNGTGTTHTNLWGLYSAPVTDGAHTVTLMSGLVTKLTGSSNSTINTGVGLDILAPVLTGGSTIVNKAAISVRPEAGLSYFNYPSPVGGAGVINISPNPSGLDSRGIAFDGINGGLGDYWALHNEMLYRSNGTLIGDTAPQGFARDRGTIANQIGIATDYTSFWSNIAASGAGSVESVYGFRTGGTLAGKTYTKYTGLFLQPPTGSNFEKNYGFTSSFFKHGLGTHTPTTMLEVTRPSSVYNQIPIVLVDGLSTTPDDEVEGIRITSGSQQISGTAGAVMGLNSAPNITAKGTMQEIIGVRGAPYYTDDNTAAITTSMGGYFVSVDGNVGETTTVTDAYGLYVDAPLTSGATITNNYGLVIDPLAGNNGIGSLTPDEKLIVGNGHLAFDDADKPTLTLCGTDPVFIRGNDNALEFIVGSGVVTSCTVAFAHQWADAPICIAQEMTDFTALRIAGTSVAGVNINAAADFSGDTIKVICMGTK